MVQVHVADAVDLRFGRRRDHHKMIVAEAARLLLIRRAQQVHVDLEMAPRYPMMVLRAYALAGMVAQTDRLVDTARSPGRRRGCGALHELAETGFLVDAASGGEAFDRSSPSVGRPSRDRGSRSGRPVDEQGVRDVAGSTRPRTRRVWIAEERFSCEHAVEIVGRELGAQRMAEAWVKTASIWSSSPAALIATSTVNSASCRPLVGRVVAASRRAGGLAIRLLRCLGRAGPAAPQGQARMWSTAQPS